MRSPEMPEPQSVVFRSNVVTAAPDPTSVVGGVGSIALTVTVDQPGGSARIDVSNRAALNPPSGAWPYTCAFPSGQGTTATITLTSNAVDATTSVDIRTCDATLDISNPANWQAVASVTIQPA